ncbi:MAG TPA: NAD(P)-dependent oxidoreductase [Kineosporiaceae bacterium]|nr:NAD(P)-dependent oxidoreductase [Kineosporiaceae bacterium]
MTRVCVTGASGKAGRVIVQDLRDHGYDVVATDITAATYDFGVIRADLTDYGQAVQVLDGVQAVVHLANIPAPGLYTPATTFNTNMAMNFNVFHAAATVGLERVVWASSETTLGLPFDVPPRYVPVDEDHYPLPTSTYALSKVASETIAEQISAWSDIPFVGLRFSNILGPSDYERFPEYWQDVRSRRWNLWAYIDERDAAQACQKALTAEVQGSSNYVIAAADTVMPRPSADLMAEVFPGVRVTREIDRYGSLLATDRARAVLGFVPEYSWRDHVAEPG